MGYHGPRTDVCRRLILRRLGRWPACTARQPPAQLRRRHCEHQREREFRTYARKHPRPGFRRAWAHLRFDDSTWVNKKRCTGCGRRCTKPCRCLQRTGRSEQRAPRTHARDRARFPQPQPLHLAVTYPIWRPGRTLASTLNQEEPVNLSCRITCLVLLRQQGSETRVAFGCIIVDASKAVVGPVSRRRVREPHRQVGPVELGEVAFWLWHRSKPFA